MSELELALSKLQGVKKIAGGYQAKCPCHNDKIASLSISERDGKLLIYCHAGCSFESIIKSLNLEPPKPLFPTISATYDYTDEEGKLLYQVVRYDPKSFRQRRPDGTDWVWNLNGVEPTLYHLPEVLEAIKENKTIFIVEGEKDVDNLRKVGQSATTISGGASTKWSPQIVTYFLNATVAIIPDKDEPGKKYAQYVANLLYGFTQSLKVINLPIKDVSDYLETNPLDSLMNIVYKTPEYVPSGVVTREEFNEWRGINIYLLRSLLRSKGKRKQYNDYRV